jgi:transposase
VRERHSVSDEGWSRVRHFFRRRSRLGRPPSDPRTVLNGVLWLLATGAPWRDLPARFGPWQTVYGHFRRWVRDGRLERVVTRLRRVLPQRRGRGRLWCVDSTVVRAARAQEAPGAMVVRQATPKPRRWVAPEAGLGPSSLSSATAEGSLWRRRSDPVSSTT